MLLCVWRSGTKIQISNLLTPQTPNSAGAEEAQ
jgi:hypothetical protein